VEKESVFVFFAAFQSSPCQAIFIADGLQRFACSSHRGNPDYDLDVKRVIVHRGQAQAALAMF
jgi:hypothetical protein